MRNNVHRTVFLWPTTSHLPNLEIIWMMKWGFWILKGDETRDVGDRRNI